VKRGNHGVSLEGDGLVLHHSPLIGGRSAIVKGGCWSGGSGHCDSDNTYDCSRIVTYRQTERSVFYAISPSSANLRVLYKTATRILPFDTRPRIDPRGRSELSLAMYFALCATDRYPTPGVSSEEQPRHEMRTYHTTESCAPCSRAHGMSLEILPLSGLTRWEGFRNEFLFTPGARVVCSAWVLFVLLSGLTVAIERDWPIAPHPPCFVATPYMYCRVLCIS
jgi:hypothetical protein